MLIPYDSLSEDVLFSVAKEWVISKTADIEELPNVEKWTNDVVKKIKVGELLIEFSEENQSVTIKSPEEINFETNENINH
ncbi:MAG: hypothetical protein COA86_09665 [Kangiella sp.]|nr:MAG: hypothetical protein COA86_09665 [Kangiella sp.]